MNKITLFKNLFIFSPHIMSYNIIPKQDIVKKSLVVVIAIMCFLCTTGLAAVYLLNNSVKHWNSQISSEATIEVTPRDGYNVSDDLKSASELAMNFAGVYDTEILSENSTKKLLEPWLGNNLSFNDLPIPRVIIIHLAENSYFDPIKFKKYLYTNLPNCNFNNNQAWIKQLQAMADSCTIIVSFIVLLLSCALIITIIFATLSAVSANKHIIEILHFLSADKSYIAKQFDVVFFYKAIQGALIGALATILLFFALFYFNSQYNNYHVQLSAFFGNFHLGVLYYVEMIILVFFVVMLTVFACRVTVLKQLYSLETKL